MIVLHTVEQNYWLETEYFKAQTLQKKKEKTIHHCKINTFSVSYQSKILFLNVNENKRIKNDLGLTSVREISLKLKKLLKISKRWQTN